MPSIVTSNVWPTPLRATSGNVANASAVATLAGAVDKTTYITGFDISGTGATAASVVVVTIAGLLGGSITYTLASVAGATAGNGLMSVRFPDGAMPASASNTAITVTCPALGAGATNNVVNAYGYQM